MISLLLTILFINLAGILIYIMTGLIWDEWKK
jgi:hypothetical protein